MADSTDAGKRAKGKPAIRDRLEEMGRNAQRFVRENFLITRRLRECLTLIVGLAHGDADRLELG